MTRPTATELLETPGALLTRTYLRELGLVRPPANVTILQGHDMGRPSRLTGGIANDRAEISVAGRALRIEP